MRIRDDLVRLQDTTAQIRVRAAMLLLIGFAAIAEALGLEAILGAFAAGAVVSLVDRDEFMTHPDFRLKLEAIGFGFFIPVFFVTSGVRYDLDALLAKPSNLAMLPIFLAALVAVRGLPALLYRPVIGDRRALVAGLMQATSLPFIVAATAIGLDLGLLDGAQAAALVGAGLLSVLVFPAAGLAVLSAGEEAAPEHAADATGRTAAGWAAAGGSTATRSSTSASTASGRASPG
jgi:Kef-type K+ transport system membrane component KefB